MKTLLLPLAFLPLLAQAASTVDLSVTGLITPSACEPSLSNGGEYDLGKVPAKSLNPDKTTPLSAANLPFSMTCEALTLLALQPRDNRLGSSYESDKTFTFGLGLANGSEKLGSMTLRMLTITADGAGMRPIGSSGPSTWAPTSIMSPEFLTAFTPNENPVPAAIRQLSANLQVSPIIAPANTLTLTEEVPIDGAVTLTVKYL